MKGIFLKLFYPLKNNIITISIIIISLTIVYTFLKIPVRDLIIPIFVFVVVKNSFLQQEALDKQNNFNDYLRILPIKSNKIILAKYLFILFTLLIILGSGLLFSVFVKEETEIIIEIKYCLGYFVAFNFLFLNFSISYLMFMIFKSNFVSIFIGDFIGIGLSLLINSTVLVVCTILFGKIFNLNFENYPKSIFLLISLIDTIISMSISYLVYKISCFKYIKSYN